MCDSTVRVEACAWFPPALPHAPFPFVGWALYPLAVINHSHEYDYMLSPPRELSNIGCYLGSPQHTSKTHKEYQPHGMPLFQCDQQILAR